MTEGKPAVERPMIRRRTLAQGVAWSVPVVAVAGAAPAFAASGRAPDVLIGVACKLPGSSLDTCPSEIATGIFAGDFSKAFALPTLVTNNTSKDIVLKPSIVVSNVRDGDGNPTLPFDVLGIFPDYCTPIGPGQSLKILIFANSDNSANDDVRVDLTVPWGHDCADTDHDPIFIPNLYAPAFPPCSSKVPFPTGAPSCTPPFYQS